MFKNLLVPVDGSKLAEQALGTASAIARAGGGEIGLIFAHHPRRQGVLDSTWDYGVAPEDRIYVHRLAEEVAQGAQLVVSGAVESGEPVSVICRRVGEVGADLIVMTSHGRTGLSRAWLGSVADGVVRSASIPVLLLRPDDAHIKEGGKRLFPRILVPLDGSTTSSAIIPAAAALAKASGGALVLLRVVEPVPIYVFDAALPAYPTSIPDPESTQQLVDGARDELNELAPRVESAYGFHVETEVVTNPSPAHAILDTARHMSCDLIAMTTHSRGTSRLFLGSVTDKVLRGGHLPMLLYHPHSQERRAP